MPYMNNFWEHLIADIFPKLTDSKSKYFFVDPADLQKRNSEDIHQMLSLLGQINEFIPVILSVNDKDGGYCEGAKCRRNPSPR